MNDLSTLQTLRSEVPEPTASQLDAAFEALASAMNAPSRPDAIVHKFRKTRWILGAAAAVTVVTIVAGNLHMTAQSAEAASTLQRIAGVTITYSDPVPGPGEYLLAETHARWTSPTVDSEGKSVPNEQLIQVYKPVDPGADWVLYRDWGNQRAATVDGHIELIRAQNGEFYGPDSDGAPSPWVQHDISSIPEGTGAEVLAHFDAQYQGGSASRDEDNFERITSLLLSGLVPADVRARLFEALALIPGVTATAGVANADGTEGVVIGRVEVLRGGMRQEIIVDPDTGLVIGDRGISTVALFGVGINDILWETAITTTVAPTAP